MRKPLKKSEQGKRQCVMVGNTEMCVVARKFGFDAHLKSRRGAGEILPVPTGKARTMKTAIKNARSFIKKVRSKS